MRVSISTLKYKILLILIIGMPFHRLLINILDLQPLVLWRDVLIVILLLLSAIQGFRSDNLSMLSFFKLFCCVVFACIFHDRSMSAGIWVNVLRVYIMPSLVIISCSKMQISEKKLNVILRTYVAVSAVVATFGLIQLFFIGKSYLRLIGVGQSSVLLADGTQRNIGTFESSNIMATYMLFSIIILLFKKDLFKRKTHLMLLILFLVSFVFTYSMSAFLAFAIVMLLYVRKIETSHIKAKKVARYLILGIIIALLTVMIVISNPKLFDILHVQIGEKVSEILLTIKGINYNSNSSALKHYNDLIDGFAQVLKNPMGLRFAKESFMVSDKVTYRTLNGLRESSIITIFFDFGILVGIVYLAPIFYSLWKFIKINNDRRSYREIAIGIIISMITIYVFLPIIQSFELSFYLSMFIGLFYYYPRFR